MSLILKRILIDLLIDYHPHYKLLRAIYCFSYILQHCVLRGTDLFLCLSGFNEVKA